MSKSILYKCDCFHVFTSIWIVISVWIKDDIEIKLSGSNMKLIIPKIQWKKRHWEFLLEKLSNLNCELFNVGNKIVILGFIEKFKEESSYFGHWFHFRNDACITGIHEGYIIDFFFVLSHHLKNLVKRDFFFNYIIMLIDDDMLCFGIVLHDIFDVFSKSTSKLPF